MTLHSSGSSDDTRRERIWILSELYYPEGSATGYYLTGIAEGIAADAPVSVLCAQPTYSARGMKAPWREVHRGVAIRRCWGTTLDKNKLLTRFLNLLSISTSVFWHAVRLVKRGEPILAVTNPPTLPFVAALVAKIKRGHSIILIHDVYPDVLVAAGLARPTSLWMRVLGAMQRWVYRSSRMIIVLGRDMKRLVEGRLSEGKDRVTIIPNWADTETIRPEPRSQNRLLAELGLTDRFVIQYSGNMGRTHDLESLVRCARACAEDPELHFLFLGSGAKEVWLRRTIDESGLTNMTFLPPRPRGDLQTSLSACDIAIIAFVPGMSGISVPSRMYNVMAAGKPILAVADPESELALLVNEERIGWVVAPKRPDLLAETILNVKRRPEDLAAMGARARHVAESRYSYASVIAKYSGLYRHVTRSG